MIWTKVCVFVFAGPPWKVCWKFETDLGKSGIRIYYVCMYVVY